MDMVNEMVFAITKGNPGALSVVRQAAMDDLLNLELILQWGKIGSDLWVEYKKDNKDINALLKRIKEDINKETLP